MAYQPTLIGVIEANAPHQLSDFSDVVKQRTTDHQVAVEFGVVATDDIPQSSHRYRMFREPPNIIVVEPLPGGRVDVGIEEIGINSKQSQEFTDKLVFDKIGDRIEFILHSVDSAFDGREKSLDIILVIFGDPNSHNAELWSVSICPDLSLHFYDIRAVYLEKFAVRLFPHHGIDPTGGILKSHLQHFAAVKVLQLMIHEHEEIGNCIPLCKIFNHARPPGVQGNESGWCRQGKCLSKLLNLFSLAEMRILSRYILKEHLGPFLFAFFVVTFVLILDFVPNVIDMAIGKDLDLLTIIWVFILNLAWMLALSIPMATLVATLMAFGRMTSDLEILAIKSSGIHLIQLLRPVLIGSVILAAFLVWFNNEVLPDANHKARILMSDIRVMRPTLSIRSNVFLNDIPGYVILISDIDHKTSRIKDVTIFDRRDPQYPRMTLAEGGKLEYRENGTVLSFQLENGETHEPVEGEKNQWQWVTFEKQTVNIRDIDRSFQRTNSSYRGDREMSSEDMLEETRK